MVNWQVHGVVASLKDFRWYKGDNGAWAECVVERNGRWYMYCPIHGHGIGVLVSDSPYGPFKDPLGHPLVWRQEHWYDIDPSVYIDDDGQAYMYWGNPYTYCVKLKEDMISIDGDIMTMDRIDDYQEGPWFWARKNDKGEKWYYLAFASTCCPEGIGYAMSKSPTAPWKHMGHIMDHTPRTRGNKADGTIKELPYFQDCKLEQIGTFNPYRRVEAETMAWGYGLKTTRENPSGPWNETLFVTDIDDGEYILVRGIDFGKKGALKFHASCSSQLYGGRMEFRVEAVDGS